MVKDCFLSKIGEKSRRLAQVFVSQNRYIRFHQNVKVFCFRGHHLEHKANKKMFADHTSGKGRVSRIHKEHLQLKNCKTNHLI